MARLTLCKRIALECTTIKIALKITNHMTSHKDIPANRLIMFTKPSTQCQSQDLIPEKSQEVDIFMDEKIRIWVI